MFNAEEIIELEKKWIKYKIKQKSKVYIFFMLFVFIISVLVYRYYLPQKTIATHNKIIKENVLVKKEIKKVKAQEYTPIKPIIEKKISDNSAKKSPNNIVVKREDNKTILQKNNNITNNETLHKITTKQQVQDKPLKEYYFKLIPTKRKDQLFSTDGSLNFNFSQKEIKRPTVEKKQVIQPIRESAKTYNVPKETMKIKKKPTIEIGMKEVNTITYLKQKFYSTSSIVFALMLSEEYYNEKNYKNSLKWALAANDIDSQNTKTWYWFAKSKVKLNKKEDAIRALKAYLSNNKSKRLQTLLKKIELGDTND